MIDEATAAAALYGTPVPARLAPAQADPHASAYERDERQAAALYPAEAGEPETDIYGEPLPLKLDAVQRGIQTAALERFDLPPEEAQQSALEWGTLFKTYEVGAESQSTLTELGIGAMANPPDDAQMLSWQNAARSELTSAFGDSADLALADAQKMVAGHKALGEFLDRTGLGSHPRVVLQLAERARYLRTRGKL